VIRRLSLIAENADIKKKVFRIVDRFMVLVESCLFFDAMITDQNDFAYFFILSI